ncbi:hypothetical protein CC78DRAFT_531671 [Lojkania enalia]|uniref:Uncharacterized protein n=1 Tax=Lojkania enalia TaxID=147567 RepID=A0A9P4KHI5_9PLEO|nr:hypothetical protein CC78DRAFT_531671 [Didymosphaeria enalia]
MEIVHLIGAGVKVFNSVKKFADGFEERELYATRLWDSLQDLGIRLEHLNIVDLEAAANQAWHLDNDSKKHRSTVEKFDNGRRSLFNVLSAQNADVRGQCMAGALFVKAMLANVEDTNRNEEFIQATALFAWCKAVSGKDLGYYAGTDSRSKAVASFVYEPLWRAIGKFAHGEDTMFNARSFRDHGMKNVFPGMPMYPDWLGNDDVKPYDEHKNTLALFMKKKHLVKSKERRKYIFQNIQPSLFAQSGQYTGQLLNAERGHEALFLSTSLNCEQCKVVYHPFDVAFMKWIARGQSLSLVSAKNNFENLDAVIPRSSPHWDVAQEWIFVFPQGNNTLPASLQALAPPLASMHRMGDYHFYAVASTSDVLSEESIADPSNLQYKQGEIVVIHDLDFTRIWDANSTPQSLWFHGTVNGKEMDIYARYLYPIYDHSDPKYARSTFCGKDRQMMLKTTANLGDGDEVVPGKYETYPLGSLFIGVECQTTSLWYEPDEKTYFPSQDMVIVNQSAAWREYLYTVFHAQFDEDEPAPYDIADYWD